MPRLNADLNLVSIVRRSRAWEYGLCLSSCIVSLLCKQGLELDLEPPVFGIALRFDSIRKTCKVPDEGLRH